MKKICTPSSAALVSMVLLAHGGLGYFLHTMRPSPISAPKPPIVVELLPDVPPKPVEMGEDAPSIAPAPPPAVVQRAAPPRSRPIAKPVSKPIVKPVVLPTPAPKILSVAASKSTVIVPVATHVASPNPAPTAVVNNTPVVAANNSVSTGNAKEVVSEAPAPKLAAVKVATGETSQASFGAAYLNNPKPTYPPLSRAREEEGTVLLRVSVSATGSASSVEVMKGSGFSALDRAAKSAVERWKFVPAKRNGENVEGIVIVPMPFKLDD